MSKSTPDKKLCIIPARGGSKRIPRKNIKDFLGKPIIAYSIEAALNSGLFDEVMVSTDDKEIADIAKKYGATVPFFRSLETSDDYATTVDVLLEVLAEYKKTGVYFYAACCIYPTAPLIQQQILGKGLEKLLNERLNVVFPVVSFGYPIWRGLQWKSDKLVMVWPENINKRSQDLEEIYHDAGQWYWFITETLQTNKKLMGENSSGITIDRLQVQDIDTLTDWKLAELKYELLHSLK